MTVDRIIKRARLGQNLAALFVGLAFAQCMQAVIFHYMVLSATNFVLVIVNAGLFFANRWIEDQCRQLQQWRVP